jgi:hypothetical protein|nr:MAG TPA_asm: zinc-ribbon domain protein [Caudoviricetes sp.]
MAEYIERRTAIEHLNVWCGGCGSAVECILAEPAADVAPVVHGRDVYKWHKEGHCEFKCSVCGAWAGIIEGGTLDGVDFDYCPNCGAKMDLEDGGGEDAAD